MPPAMPIEPPTWQQEQWHYEQQPAAPPCYGIPFPSGGDELSAPQQPDRPASRQRRRARPPRDPGYQQPRGAGGRQLQMEAAASAAANRTQQRRQAAAVAADESGHQSSSDEPAAAEYEVFDGPQAAAADGAPGLARSTSQRRRERRERAGQVGSGGDAPAAAAPAADGPAAAAVGTLAEATAALQVAEPDAEAPHCLICTSPVAEASVFGLVVGWESVALHRIACMVALDAARGRKSSLPRHCRWASVPATTRKCAANAH